ncbi:MAG: 3-dehydroquinate synthase [Saprospiraceae bacterium]
MNPTFQLGDCLIYLGDLRENFPAWLRQRAYSQFFILTDENTRRDCLKVFLEKTDLAEEAKIAEIPAGEHFKTLATCQQIWQQMLDARLDRRALVVNLGGGVIGDMGGFCAATWKRGVDFVQVPTTLLAMTDAAIGGKLGIDFQNVKNTIGVFQNPTAVFVDSVFLKTLPECELRSGFAEVIKHAFIGDSQLSVPSNRDQLSESSWLNILRASIAVKVRVVQEDPLEKGLRALLNFGHTIGHALESYFLTTNEPLTHGEAVAIGMICESQVGHLEKLEEVVEIVRSHFPHRPIPESAFPEIWNRMQQDKKNAAGKVRMALPGEGPFSMQILEPSREEIEQSLLFYNSLKFSQRRRGDAEYILSN